jgi:hypothetical protein
MIRGSVARLFDLSFSRCSQCPLWVRNGHGGSYSRFPLHLRKQTSDRGGNLSLQGPLDRRQALVSYSPALTPATGGQIAALRFLQRGRLKNLRLRSIVCAARHGLPRVMLLSKAWGKRRVSACASLHHCHWDWHSGRICTVVFLTHGGEWDSFRPNALTCSTRQ